MWLCGKHSFLVKVMFLTQPALAAFRIVPTPQYIEPERDAFEVLPGGSLTISLGPAGAASQPKMWLAADILRGELLRAAPAIAVDVQAFNTRLRGPGIYLWNYTAGSSPPVELSFLDRQTLEDPGHYGQSYIIRVHVPDAIWVIGSTEQGVLYGAMSVLQLIQKKPSGVQIAGVYIRDYPDFEFRAASDWLLRIEISHWALDRGQGVEAFARLCERKLDRALRFKINMVLIDGFGWGLEQRFQGYAELMRRLNRYARARGIHLVFGGYGAGYDLARKSGEYLGQVFENRESYPNGPTYRCLGPPHRGAGSCRANDELNRLKAEELRRFVEAVEPGALYIHHEDCCDFEAFEKAWLGRCVRCRRRWPNDSFQASDGGAGALAHGYTSLIRAVNSVKNPAVGYDASRDCQVILVSPVYMPASSESEEWARVLELWKNIGLELPRQENIQIGLREVFPQKFGGRKWVEAFNSIMTRAGLNYGAFLFFIGGADNFMTDYPLTGAPAMNAMFRGARSIYNATGDFYQEPMEVINAEYSWNTRSTGFFRDPLRYDEAFGLWQRYMYEQDQPPEIFGGGGLYEVACQLLYGPSAGRIMGAYYRESVWLPDRDPIPIHAPASVRRPISYVPQVWDRAYPVPAHWLHLEVDSASWDVEIKSGPFRNQMDALRIDRPELHRRLAHRWSVVAQLNAKGSQYVSKALAADPLPESIEDLKFLQIAFRVYQPLVEALAEFHRGMQLRFEARPDLGVAAQYFSTALAKAREARQLAIQFFPHPVDPMGADVGAIRVYTEHLIEAIHNMRVQR